MKHNQLIISVILICLVNWTGSSQIEEFLNINRPIAIDFQSDIMYMALNSSGGPVTDGSIARVDITDPDLSVETLVENLIYTRAIKIVDNYLYYSTITGVHRIDITIQNPEPETLVVGGSTVRGFSFKNNFLYLAESDRISKIDITQENFSKITVVDGFTNAPLALAELNNELYIAHGYNVSKIDLSESTPVLIEVLTNLNGIVYGMDFLGSYLYIEQTFTSGGDKKIVKCDMAQINLTIEDVVDVDGFYSVVDIRFHENDLYIVYAGNSANKISRLENADALSIDEFILIETKALYPNPSNSTFTISNVTQDTAYTIYDVNGRDIKKGITTSNLPISIEVLDSGIYYIKLDNNTFKLIKE